MAGQTSSYQIGVYNQPRVYTLAEATALFPLVRRVTQKAYEELEPVRRKLEAMLPTNPQITDVEKQYEVIVKRWVADVRMRINESHAACHTPCRQQWRSLENGGFSAGTGNL